jgi:ATP-dependent helicase YprA (DUF1998 family)
MGMKKQSDLPEPVPVRAGEQQRTRAIVIYPMNALANTM